MGAWFMKLVSDKQPFSAREEEAVVRLRALVKFASIEATPRQILALEHLPDLLPVGTCVYVPFLPKGQFSDTLQACRHLLSVGMQPIPHVPARMAVSRGQLRDWLSQLDEAGVDRLLLIAGDSDAIAGPFPDTLAVLESGLLAQFQFHGIGAVSYTHLTLPTTPYV